jgi:hypothetical protein
VTETEQDPIPDTPAAPPEPPPSEAEQWTLRVDALHEGLLAGTETTEDADLLYSQLVQALAAKRAELRAVLAAGTYRTSFEELEQLHATSRALYATRIRLLPELSPGLRSMISGTTLAGVGELRGELDHVALQLRYRRALVPRQLAEWLAGLRQAPLPVVWQLVQLAVLILLFRWWRGWAPGGLAGWRSRLLQAKTRTQHRLRLARLVWYLERVRDPLEWLILAEIAQRIIDIPPLQQQLARLLTVLRWTLLAWFLVACVHAVAARGKAGLAGETARVRLRSLRLLAAWLALLGLGLQLAVSFAGRGTLHAWVWLTFEILAVPVLVLLTIWWRRTIFLRLEVQGGDADWLRALLRHQRGLRGFAAAVIGGLYLIGLQVARAASLGLATSEWGRSLQGRYYQRGVARLAASQKPATDAEPIADDLRAQLLQGSGGLVERVGREELRRIVALIERGSGGAVALVADRGFGKTAMLRRVASSIDGRTLVVDCPPGGAEALYGAFARVLGIEAAAVSAENIARALDGSGHSVVALNRLHRQYRPVMGGQCEADRVAEIPLLVSRPLLWIFALNRVAWRYISRARAHRMALDDVLELPVWTERQIGELIELRCTEAGIEPDFSGLILPRRIDEGQYDTVDERNRAGIYRLITTIAGGSPSMALKLWTEALAVAPGGRIVVRLPGLPETGELQRSAISLLLVLRVIMQCELASADDVIKSLRLSTGEAHNALRFLMQRGWIELDDGRYQVSDSWYGAVVSVLDRQNLIQLRQGGGLL